MLEAWVAQNESRAPLSGPFVVTPGQMTEIGEEACQQGKERAGWNPSRRRFESFPTLQASKPHEEPKTPRDDTDYIQGLLDRGEPIPPGNYTIRGTIRLASLQPGSTEKR